MCNPHAGIGSISRGFLVLYKFGSLCYLISAGIFCLDVMILHRYTYIYITIHYPVADRWLIYKPVKPFSSGSTGTCGQHIVCTHNGLYSYLHIHVLYVCWLAMHMQAVLLL